MKIKSLYCRIIGVLQETDRETGGFLNKNNKVFFYDHDYDEKPEPMNISFEQWLQMASVIRQLDLYLDEHDDISEPLRQKFL
jgi:hypothetical protein